MVKNWKDFWTKSTLLSLGLGQLLSLLVTFAGFTSSQLAKKEINAPLSQCWLSYVLLALFYGCPMIYRGKPFKEKWHYYSMLASIDVYPKLFVIWAYKFTSLTSILLLDYWTIPCVVFLSWLFLKTKYEFQKLVGVAICVAGLGTVVLSDLHSADRLTSVMAPMGDLTLIVGATFYGIRNVVEEHFFKKANQVEIMAVVGIFGSFYIVPLIAMFEVDQIKSILLSPETTFLVIGYSIAMFLFYSGVSLLLKNSGSTMRNLSLLTSNMWAVLIRLFSYHEKVNWIYFLAFAIVTLGLIVYSCGDEMDPNISEVVSIDKETDLGHPNNGEVAAIDKETDLGHKNNGEVAAIDKETDLGHPNNGEVAAIDKETDLGHPNNGEVAAIDKETDLGHTNNGEVVSIDKETDLGHPNNGEVASIDKETDLGHLDNVRISNNDGSGLIIHFKGSEIPCIKIYSDNVRISKYDGSDLILHIKWRGIPHITIDLDNVIRISKKEGPDIILHFKGRGLRLHVM